MTLQQLKGMIDNFKTNQWPGIAQTIGDPTRFLALPQETRIKDVAVSAAGTGLATGSIAATLAALLSQRRKRKRNTIIAGLSGLAGGAALGAGGSLLSQNAQQQLAGRQLGPYKPLQPSIETDPDAPARQYSIHIPGMGSQPIRWSKEQQQREFAADPNRLLVRWGELGKAVAFISKLRPKDQLDIVGFSMGGPAALHLSRLAKRPVRYLQTLDPVNPRPLAILQKMLVGSPFNEKPKNVGQWVNYISRGKGTGQADVFAQLGGGSIAQTDADVTQINNGGDTHGVWNAKQTSTEGVDPQRKKQLAAQVGMLPDGTTPAQQQDSSLMGKVIAALGAAPANRPRKLQFNQEGQSAVVHGRIH